MELYLFYLLKVSILIALFITGYEVFLKKTTFFVYNRRYLLAGIFLSFLLPALQYTKYTEKIVEVNEMRDPQMFFNTAKEQSKLATTITQESVAPSIPTEDYTNKEIEPLSFQPLEIIFFISLGGSFLVVIILLFRYFSLFLLLKGTQSSTIDNISYRMTENLQGPFSFFNILVLNPKLHSPEERKIILAHEQVHIHQKHSIDITLIHWLLIFQWFNPLFWLYKKRIEQNLEFIADKYALKEIADKKKYQLTILKSIPLPNIPITNQFNHSFIKKRIVMLHQKQSNLSVKWRLLGLAPFLALFLYSFNYKEKVTLKEINSPSEIKFSDSSKETNNNLEPKEKGRNKNASEISSHQKEGNLNSIKPKQIKAKTEENPKTDSKPKFYTYSFKKSFTKEEIDSVQKLILKEHKVIMIFHSLDFYDGFISKINVSFKDENGHTGSYADEDTNNPIMDFLFLKEVDEDGELQEMKFLSGSLSEYYIKKEIGKANIRLKELGDEPAYLINDTLYQNKELIGKYYVTKEDFEIIPEENAIKLYGNKGKNGIIRLIDVYELSPGSNAILKNFLEDYGKKDLHFMMFYIGNEKMPTIGWSKVSKGPSTLKKANKYKWNTFLINSQLPEISNNPELQPAIEKNGKLITYEELLLTDIKNVIRASFLPPEKITNINNDSIPNGILYIYTE